MTTITSLPTPPTRSDPTNFASRADDFLAALPTFASQTNAVASEVNAANATAMSSASAASASATAASTSASEAAASAASAVNAPGTSATSTTSLAIGTGSKSLTIQTGKAFVVGQFVIIASSATPANYMIGQITAYTSGTGALVVNVTSTGGTGTLAAWNVALTAAGGVVSVNGASGAVTGIATLTGTETLTNKTITSPTINSPSIFSLREIKTVMSTDNIDLSAANLFTKTITTNTTLTISNIPSSNTLICFILELTNAAAFNITWFSGVKWASGTAPTLTSSGKDVLGFYTHDSGTTWNGFLLGKDVK